MLKTDDIHPPKSVKRASPEYAHYPFAGKNKLFIIGNLIVIKTTIHANSNLNRRITKGLNSVPSEKEAI